MNNKEKFEAMEFLVAHKEYKWCDYCYYGESCPLSFRGKFCTFKLREDYDRYTPIIPHDNPIWTTK